MTVGPARGPARLTLDPGLCKTGAATDLDMSSCCGQVWMPPNSGDLNQKCMLTFSDCEEGSAASLDVSYAGRSVW